MNRKWNCNKCKKVYTRADFEVDGLCFWCWKEREIEKRNKLQFKGSEKE